MVCRIKEKRNKYKLQQRVYLNDCKANTVNFVGIRGAAITDTTRIMILKK